MIWVFKSRQTRVRFLIFSYVIIFFVHSSCQTRVRQAVETCPESPAGWWQKPYYFTWLNASLASLGTQNIWQHSLVRMARILYFNFSLEVYRNSTSVSASADIRMNFDIRILIRNISCGCHADIENSKRIIFWYT